jgi:hypothetical protein
MVLGRAGPCETGARLLPLQRARPASSKRSVGDLSYSWTRSGCKFLALLVPLARDLHLFPVANACAKLCLAPAEQETRRYNDWSVQLVSLAWWLPVGCLARTLIRMPVPEPGVVFHLQTSSPLIWDVAQARNLW